MRRTARISALALGAAAAMSLAGTAAAHPGHHDPEGHAEEPMKVSVAFQAIAGSSPVTCGNPIPGLGTTGATAQLRDLRFYVSNVRLVRRNGTTAPLKLARDDAYNMTGSAGRVTMIDLENAKGACTEGDAQMNKVVRGTVTEGEYVGIRMYMGVPFGANHTDTVTAPAPLDLTAMGWAWQSGRKFAKIELSDPAGAGGNWASKVFNVHLGSTGCVGNPAAGATVSCSDSNRMAVRFARFDPARQKIAIDLQALTAGNDITVNRAGAPGCMSGPTDPECAGVMAGAMALDWRADGTGTGQPVRHGAAQTLFTVRPR